MIIKTLKDAELKISRLWNKDPLIDPDKSHIVQTNANTWSCQNLHGKIVQLGQYHKQLKCPFKAPQYPW
jgi:hypothetical protein